MRSSQAMRDSVDAEKVIKKLGEQIGMLTVQMAMLETKLTEAKETIAKYESEASKCQAKEIDCCVALVECKNPVFDRQVDEILRMLEEEMYREEIAENWVTKTQCPWITT